MNAGRQQGRRDGLLEGIELSLELKFGVAGLEVMSFVKTIHNLDQLHVVRQAIKTTRTLAELKAIVLSCS